VVLLWEESKAKVDHQKLSRSIAAYFLPSLPLTCQMLKKAKIHQKGPVVKTLHYVSDKIWDYIKTLTE
jgi:hypothetical protein